MAHRDTVPCSRVDPSRRPRWNWRIPWARCADRIRSIRSNLFAMSCGNADCGRLAASALHRRFPEAHVAGRVKRFFAGDPAWLALDPHLQVEHRHRAVRAMGVSDPPHGFYIRELRTGLDHTLMSWDGGRASRTGPAERGPVSASVLRPGSGRDALSNAAPAPERGRPFQGTGARTLAKRFPGLRLERQRKVLSMSFFRALLLREGPALADLAGNSLRSRVLVLSMGQRWVPSSARR